MSNSLHKLMDIIMSHDLELPSKVEIDEDGLWEIFQEAVSTTASSIEGDKYALDNFVSLAIVEFIIKASEAGHSNDSIRIFLEEIKNG